MGKDLRTVDEYGMFGTTGDGRPRHYLVFARDFPIAQDLAEATVIIGEQPGSNGVAPPMAGAALCINGDLHELVSLNTSGKSVRCNVPEGHTTSGSASSASS